MRTELQTQPPHPPSSLQLGTHLQESGLLLHDAHQQRVNVVLQISDLRLQLLQLHLPLSQQKLLPLELRLLPLQLCLALHQQGDQFTVVQVVVRARPFCRRLKTSRQTGREGKESVTNMTVCCLFIGFEVEFLKVELFVLEMLLMPTTFFFNLLQTNQRFSRT